MSKTLSKILVVCAMVVIFPLMVVGTAFASFYSIDSTTIIEVYAGTQSKPTDAFAQIQSGDDAGEKLEITKGHLKQIEVKTLSNGYDFVGWFNGTVEEYIDSENAEFISQETKLSAKASDYENIVAVFELKSYNFNWSYISDPENMDDVSTDAPEGSKETYYWGDALPTLANDNFDFNGWTLEGDSNFYSTAKFETSGEYTLNAGQNSWISHGQVAVNYYDGQTLLATETVYKESTVALKEVSTLVTMQAGYVYSWKDSRGNTPSQTFIIAKEYEGETLNLYLNKKAVAYTANIASSELATYKDASINFTIENKTALEALFVEENWNKYSFHEIAGISYNGTTYTASQTNDLLNAVISAGETAEESPEFEVVLSEYFTTFKANQTGLISSYDAIYQQGEVVELSFNGMVTYASSGTLAQLLDIEGKTFVNDTEDDAPVVDVAGIRITWADGSHNDFNATRDSKLTDLIEQMLAVKSVANAEEFVVESLIVNFA